MRRWRLQFLIPAIGLMTACATAPSPVPVVGPPADLRQLEGEWVGEYSSRTTGREGGLIFELAGDEDTAHGEVWMLLRQLHGPPRPETREAAMVQPLTIRFVRVDEDFISGTLAPYPEPETGHLLLTTFHGRLRGERILGTFVTENILTGEWSAGIWSADRRAERDAPRIDP